MSDDAADRTAADDPTQIVAPPDSAQLPLLTRRLLDAAVERGLITPSQAELLTGALESEGANPERAISVMVERGLIKRAAGETLWSELQDGVIPGYRLTTELGRGAMGVVYRARQLRLDRDVALKVINPALATDPASSTGSRRRPWPSPS